MESQARLRVRNRRSPSGDRLFASFVAATASTVVLTVLGIGALLLLGAREALEKFGLGFITGSVWDPVKEQFGTWPYVFGTISTSMVGLLLAAPIAIGAALFVVEYAPAWLRDPVSFMVETLAAIPSIIYGLWGFFVLAPIMRSSIEPALKDTLGQVPGVGVLFSGPAIGKDLLTGGVILAIMIVPTIMSVAREVIANVPDTQREGMIALGATKWETIWLAVLPFARGGLFGAAILGLGRALGETMAVTLVVGNSSTRVTGSLLTPGYTLASAIANQFNEADKPLYFSAVIGVALVLMVVAATVNILARFLIWRVGRSSRLATP